MLGFSKKPSRSPVDELIDKMCEGRYDNRSRCLGYFRTISYDLTDSDITREWTEVISTVGTILVDGVGLLADHFLIWKDGSPIFNGGSRYGTEWRCVISDDALLTGPLFDIKDGIYNLPFSTLGGDTPSSKSLAEQLRWYGFMFTLRDSSDIVRAAEVAAKMVNKIKRANRLLTNSALIVREYCYVDFNTDSVLFQKVTPERVDAICNAIGDAIMTSNGGAKPEFIDEYRQYIIRALASKGKSLPPYSRIEYDWPEVNVPVYPDFVDEHMESIRTKRAEEERRKGRAVMNRKYKKVIDEIKHYLAEVN